MIKFKALTPDGEIIKSALTPFLFPAGEAHTKFEDRRQLEAVEIALLQPQSKAYSVGTESLHDDLFQLAMWADTIDQMNVGQAIKKAAVIPYFPGARADRGTPFGLKVYTDFVNSLGIEQIILFDPHSQKTPQLVKAWGNVTVVYSEDLFDTTAVRSQLPAYAGVIAPDKGAVLRAQGVANVLGVPMYKAEKNRDEKTGKLSGFTCEPLPDEGHFLLVDDICDGGGTFLGLAEATGLPKERLDLYVSFGIFSGRAFDNLPKSFDHIYTTNAYRTGRLTTYENAAAFPGAPLGAFSSFDVTRLLLSKVTK